ncbi:MAG TPA: tetratricopeptide repeat protein [Candidatus Acidoferrales bacterium]|nr:tetratricopeptide repeat protein [Candidatus Acidoferrales bacterium]
MAGRLAARWKTVNLAAVLAGLALAGTAAAAAQRPDENPNAIRVEPSVQLFATLCAVYAAGYPVAPGSVPPAFGALVRRLALSNGPAVASLREFYKSHELDTPAATLARYVSFAMVAGPPPAFDFLVPEEGLPPDVRALDGFRRVLGDFYLDQHIDRLWAQAAPAYANGALRLRGPVSQLVLVSRAYIRQMNGPQGGRSFSVYVDPLIGSETNFRIYSERYGIAVNPGSPGALAQIRHAYLHFLLDPFPYDNMTVVDSREYLLNVAVRAPRLPQEYQDDFVAFTDECLVRAVELHLRSLSAADLGALLDQNDKDGFVMVRPLYFGLENYGRSESTLESYFPDLIKGIDVRAEAAREEQIVFSPASGRPETPAEAEADQLERWLDEGDRQIATRDAKDAVATFGRALKHDPQNMRATYGLAVALALSGDGERARQLFGKIVQAPPEGAVDPSFVAWSHIYLGRMSDLAGRRLEALSQYRAALATAGVPVAAREAAERGVEKPYTPAGTDPGGRIHR